MKPTDPIRIALEMSRDWAFLLAEDLADQPMKTVLPDGGNHAMWIVGHAAHSEGGLCGMITGEPNPLEHWSALFQQGSQPHHDASRYPPYREVLDQFKKLRTQTIELTNTLSASDLDAKPKFIPDVLEGMPIFATVGSVLVFTAMHQMSHFGQLADIRAALGRAPMLGVQPQPQPA